MQFTYLLAATITAALLSLRADNIEKDRLERTDSNDSGRHSDIVLSLTEDDASYTSQRDGDVSDVEQQP